MQNRKWIYCPMCKNKTRIKVLNESILEKFPLYCPKCKNEILISVKEFKVTIIEPDAKTQSQ